ncbi:MAG: phage portal protein [Gemmobacter sp.]
MGLMDFFRGKSANLPNSVQAANLPSNETRSSGTGYTAQIMAARESWISGVSGLGELTATVQSCVSLWEAGFSLADVKGTDLLTRGHMALLARALALRGEAVMLITGDGLVPCSDWDVSTRNGIPRAYRLSVSEAGGGRRETALAGEVLHLRTGSDMVAPWTGTAPLRRAALTADLLQQVETALRDIYRDAPLGSLIVHVPEGSSDDMATMRQAFRGRRGSSLVIEGVAQATAAGMHPTIGKAPDQLSPDLQRSMTAQTLDAARDAICMAFGVLPGLMNRATTGPLVREAQRHLAQLVLQPMAGLLAEEATAKLGAPVTVDVVRPMQAFDAGGKARALATMVQALAEAKAAGIEGATLQDALQFIDWADE